MAKTQRAIVALEPFKSPDLLPTAGDLDLFIRSRTFSRTTATEPAVSDGIQVQRRSTALAPKLARRFRSPQYSTTYRHGEQTRRVQAAPVFRRSAPLIRAC